MRLLIPVGLHNWSSQMVFTTIIMLLSTTTIVALKSTMTAVIGSDIVRVGVLAIVTILFVIINQFILKWILDWVMGRKHPPGPIPWPVVGNLPALNVPLPHRMLHKLAEKYGGLVYLKLGSTPCVVVSSSRMAHEIYKHHDKNFSSRPQGEVLHIMSANYKTVSMAPYGQLWQKLRKICANALAQFNISAHQNERMDEILALLNELEVAAKSGETVDLASKLYSLSSNNMTKMLISKRYFAEGTDCGSKKREAQEFKEMLAARLHISGLFFIGDFVPWLRFVDILRGHTKKSREIQDMTFNTCRKMMNLDNRRRQLAAAAREGNHETPQRDFVNGLLLLQSTDQAGDYTDEIITLLVQDMLVAGTDTSATTIEWAMAELIRNPEILRRAQDEIDSVVEPTNLITEQHLQDLPYLGAIVKETFRLHPPVPLNLPRQSIESCRIAGRYDLPQRTRLILNQWAIHRDPEAYDRPDTFDPKRFLDFPQLSMGGRDSFELLPFGLGRRVCPGLWLGTLAVTTVLGNLVHGFDWALPGDAPPALLDMTECFGLTAPRHSPLLVVPRARSRSRMRPQRV